MVFVDSSAFVATFNRHDAAHQAADQTWRRIIATGEPLVTTQLVLAETVTLLRRRGGWELSRTAGEAMLGSAIEMVALDDELLRAAWREFVRNPDPKLSLCDTVSFVVMRERRVRQAFTFDRHFADAGFQLIPG